MPTRKRRLAALESGGAELVDPEELTVVIPEWEPWDGISTDYQTGAVVTHNGKYWQNVLDGMQNTWEPGGVGIDERYWKEITYEEAVSILSGEEEENGN